jgi:hypothetical protein
MDSFVQTPELTYQMLNVVKLHFCLMTVIAQPEGCAMAWQAGSN